MKTAENEWRSWDDLIFENRNHAYGAYVVRKSYASNVNRAAAITLGFAAAIAAWSFVSRNTDLVKVVTPPERPLDFTKEITVIPQDPPKQQPARQQPRRASLTPRATAEAIDQPVEPAETIGIQSGSETGTSDDAMDVVLNGTGTE